MTNKKLFALLFSAVLAVGAGATATTFTSSALETKAADSTYSYEFTGKVYSANGTKTLGAASWTLEGNGGYWGFDATKGQQFGSGGNPYKSLVFSTDYFADFQVKTIKINTSGASSVNATFTVKLGETQVGASTKITTTATTYTFDNTTTNGAGVLSFNYTQTSSKVIYVKSIEVVYSNTSPTVTLDQAAIETYVGSETTLTATTANIDSPTYAWAVTAGEDVVSLTEVAEHPEQIKVTTLKAGTATVTVTVGTLTKSCTFNVQNFLTPTEAKEVADDQKVYVKGIVGGKYVSSFYLYEADGDSLYVYNYDSNDILTKNSLVDGDEVIIAGPISTYGGQKQINQGTFVAKVSSGNEVAVNEITTISASNACQLVSFKGALVTSVSKVTSLTANNYSALKVKVGGTDVAFVAKKNTLTQAEADAFNTLISDFIPNLTTVTVTATLTVYNGSYQINLQPQTVITEETSTLKMFAGMLIDNDMFDCTDATVGAIYADSWMGLADAYTGALSDAEKTYFKTCTANASGNVIQQAAARYDLVVTKYGLTDFAERAPAAASMNLGLINNTFNPTLIFVIAGIALAASVVTVVIVKKSKKAN